MTTTKASTLPRKSVSALIPSAFFFECSKFARAISKQCKVANFEAVTRTKEWVKERIHRPLLFELFEFRDRSLPFKQLVFKTTRQNCPGLNQIERGPIGKKHEPKKNYVITGKSSTHRLNSLLGSFQFPCAKKKWNNILHLSLGSKIEFMELPPRDFFLHLHQRSGHDR